MLEFLNSDDVDGALECIQKLLKRFHQERKIYHPEKLAGYIQRNREGIWYKEATEKGISIGAGSLAFGDWISLLLDTIISEEERSWSVRICSPRATERLGWIFHSVA